MGKKNSLKEKRERERKSEGREEGEKKNPQFIIYKGVHVKCMYNAMSNSEVGVT